MSRENTEDIINWLIIKIESDQFTGDEQEFNMMIYIFEDDGDGQFL
jgi:hypothetical protein